MDSAPEQPDLEDLDVRPALQDGILEVYRLENLSETTGNILPQCYYLIIYTRICRYILIMTNYMTVIMTQL